jgi:Flp pilus assembly protein TadG
MRDPGRRHGAAAVEFAIVLPVLMTLVLGCVDFGRLGHSYIAVTNAARAGAGYGSTTSYTAATYNSWVANVQQAVVDEMSQLYGFDATKLTVTTTVVTESGGGSRVQVTVSYPFTTVASWPGLPTTLTLAQTVVMESTVSS